MNDCFLNGVLHIILKSKRIHVVFLKGYTNKEYIHSVDQQQVHCCLCYQANVIILAIDAFEVRLNNLE